MKFEGVIFLRLLVFSDSHRWGAVHMRKAILAHPDAEAVIFLGDGIADFNGCEDLLQNKRIYSVSGNNDFYTDAPKSQIITEGNINIYITHGHYEYVKSSLNRLYETAKNNNCTLALFGHTHRQQTEYSNGIYLFNPGALINRHYGVVDIEKEGIMCIGMEVKL